MAALHIHSELVGTDSTHSCLWHCVYVCAHANSLEAKNCGLVATATITLHSVPILYKYVERVGILLWYIVKCDRLEREETFVFLRT